MKNLQKQQARTIKLSNHKEKRPPRTLVPLGSTWPLQGASAATGLSVTKVSAPKTAGPGLNIPVGTLPVSTGQQSGPQTQQSRSGPAALQRLQGLGLSVSVKKPSVPGPQSSPSTSNSTNLPLVPPSLAPYQGLSISVKKPSVPGPPSSSSSSVGSSFIPGPSYSPNLPPGTTSNLTNIASSPQVQNSSYTSASRMQSVLNKSGVSSPTPILSRTAPAVLPQPSNNISFSSRFGKANLDFPGKPSTNKAPGPSLNDQFMKKTQPFQPNQIGSPQTKQLTSSGPTRFVGGNQSFNSNIPHAASSKPLQKQINTVPTPTNFSQQVAPWNPVLQQSNSVGEARVSQSQGPSRFVGGQSNLISSAPAGSPKITNNIAVSSPFGNSSRFAPSKSPMLPSNSPLGSSNSPAPYNSPLPSSHSPFFPPNPPLAPSNSPSIQTRTPTNKPGSSLSSSLNQNKILHEKIKNQKFINSSTVQQGRNPNPNQVFNHQVHSSTNHNQAFANHQKNQLSTTYQPQATSTQRQQTPNQPPKVDFDERQKLMLKSQILAYRMILRKESLPEVVVQATSTQRQQ